MADTITLNTGTGGAVLSTDEVTLSTVVQHVQRVKLMDGALDGTALIGGDATNGLDVDVTRVSGTVTVTGAGGTFPVTDSGGSLTVDNAALAVVGGGAEATALRVTLASDSTGVVSIDDNGGSLTVDGTFFQATQPVSGTVTANLAAGVNNIGDVDVLTLPALVAGTANIGDVDVLTVPAPLSTTGGGTEATALRVTIASDSTGLVSVDDNGGSLTVDGTVAVSSLPASTNTIEVVGDAAHDAAIAGNPVRIGARALSADLTAVAAGDAVDVIASLLGKQVILPYALPAASESYASPAAVTDTADDVAFAAGGAGVRHYLTGVQVFNGHDTVGTEVVVKDGATVIWRGWAEQTGGGCSAQFNSPLRGTAATAVNVANITTGSSTYFNVQGYTALE